MNDVIFGGNEYLITRFWKVVAEIKPFKGISTKDSSVTAFERRQKAINDAFDVWKDRWPKNKTSVEIVKEMRDKMFKRRLGKSYEEDPH